MTFIIWIWKLKHGADGILLSFLKCLSYLHMSSAALKPLVSNRKVEVGILLPVQAVVSCFFMVDLIQRTTF